MQPELLRSLSCLGDMARLRLLRLMEQEELSVGELARVLQMPQSTVSRHLKLLHDEGWIARRSEGTASLYRLDRSALLAGAAQLWEVVRAHMGTSATLAQDDHRLAEVLAERRTDSREFFGRIGGDWDRLRRDLFGESFTAEALLDFLDPDWVVVDLGCGSGTTAEYLAPVVSSVIAVDREPAMIAAARKRLARFDNIVFRQENVTALALPPAQADAAILSLVMVYVPEPLAAFRELARILRPGGRALIIDMVAHDRESYRYTMGHQHLGFNEQQVRHWAAEAGMADPRYRRLRPDTSAKGPGLFVATMRKPR